MSADAARTSACATWQILYSSFEEPIRLYTANPARYDGMIYRRCGKSGIVLPAISLGLWHNFGGVDSLENSRAMLCRAFDLGVTISIWRTTTGRPKVPRKRPLAAR